MKNEEHTDFYTGNPKGEGHRISMHRWKSNVTVPTEMFRHVDWYIVTGVPKDRSTFIFRMKQS
jgi:hypothetical protein